MQGWKVAELIFLDAEWLKVSLKLSVYQFLISLVELDLSKTNLSLPPFTSKNPQMITVGTGKLHFDENLKSPLVTMDLCSGSKHPPAKQKFPSGDNIYYADTVIIPLPLYLLSFPQTQ